MSAVKICKDHSTYVYIIYRQVRACIGGKSVWLVQIFKYFLFIVAKPIALILDLALGEEMGTVHNRRQLVQLVRFHENAKVRHACDDDYLFVSAEIHISLSTLPRMSSCFLSQSVTLPGVTGRPLTATRLTSSKAR